MTPARLKHEIQMLKMRSESRERTIDLLDNNQDTISPMTLTRTMKSLIEEADRDFLREIELGMYNHEVSSS